VPFSRYVFLVLIVRETESRLNLTDTSENGDLAASHIPMGMPALPEAGIDEHFQILREWLVDCDYHGCVPARDSIYRPRRLLYVGGRPEDLCLVDTRHSVQGLRQMEYIALSHPWGDPASNKHFKSTKRNVTDHMKGVNESTLPLNFADAITVTRRLGISFLWIDSICIIQASDGDEGDFLQEAEHMQNIFGSAYCVIAASSAQGMSDGFLSHRNVPKIVALSRQDTGKEPAAQFYVSDLVDDFDRDVAQGPLSQRGWVLQERALARRTIYFSKSQTYWECGKGIRCETLSKIKRYS
jgi:hypothetical protein